MDWLIIILALAFGAFFSAAESAFASANRLRVEVEARRGSQLGLLVRRLVEDPPFYLSTTLAGMTTALVVFATLFVLALEAPLRLFYGSTLALAAPLATVASVLTALILAWLIFVVVAWFLPRSIIHENATRAASVIAHPFRVSYWLLRPLSALSIGTSRLLVRLFGVDRDAYAEIMTRKYETILLERRLEGRSPLDEGESELVSNVLALSGLRVKDSMVPRTDIEAIEEGSTIDQLRAKMVETGLSKLPVYRENIDHITGVVFAYDLFQRPSTMEEIVKPMKFVPESKRSKDLLREFLSTNASIAVVIDEYGGTAGLVTREDLLEELFGDIQDEFDVEEFVMRQTSENTFTVSGRVEVDELTERFGLVFPEGDFETIAGYLLERLGTIPSARQEFVLDGYRFVILKATANRIDLLRIIRPSSAPAGKHGNRKT